MRYKNISLNPLFVKQLTFEQFKNYILARGITINDNDLKELYTQVAGVSIETKELKTEILNKSVKIRKNNRKNKSD